MNTYRQILSFFIIAVFTGLASCERNENIDIDGFDCVDCYTDKADFIDLIVSVTLNSENPSIPLEVFFGDYENGNFDYADTATTSEYYVPVRPNNYYSVRAKYKRGSETIYVVDGDNIKQKYSKEGCDEPCYYVKGGYIDVRLLID